MNKAFNYVRIDTPERTFTFANATLEASMNEVYRYYELDTITSIWCGDKPYRSPETDRKPYVLSIVDGTDTVAILSHFTMKESDIVIEALTDHYSPYNPRGENRAEVEVWITEHPDRFDGIVKYTLPCKPTETEHFTLYPVTVY